MQLISYMVFYFIFFYHVGSVLRPAPQVFDFFRYKLLILLSGIKNAAFAEINNISCSIKKAAAWCSFTITTQVINLKNSLAKTQRRKEKINNCYYLR